ncbi:DUF4044 domain-containing protein [Clostridium weizhouense]|uniref:DUF4044 domain-containing protein n=1 Tax=Clostridium weizhouense TaxID=2859781 RepID=A0ABS7AM82_9CLOT|nr:DUF4044 domain-containing protein [Clostridium weizhouense]MBW6409765.1 DUF4044 domain-containing protein [Clostridium weizhouense]
MKRKTREKLKIVMIVFIILSFIIGFLPALFLL